jgi:hypothetical protein
MGDKHSRMDQDTPRMGPPVEGLLTGGFAAVNTFPGVSISRTL